MSYGLAVSLSYAPGVHPAIGKFRTLTNTSCSVVKLPFGKNRRQSVHASNVNFEFSVEKFVDLDRIQELSCSVSGKKRVKRQKKN